MTEIVNVITLGLTDFEKMYYIIEKETIFIVESQV